MDSKNLEQRFLNVTDFEIEERAEDSQPTLKGYAIRAGVLSQDLGGFKERILPHAFAESLVNGPDVVMLWQHQNDKVLARRSAGSLTLKDDAFGVSYAATPSTKTTFGSDAIELVSRGEVTGVSFGFVVEEENFTKEGETVIREIKSAKLHEISLVTSPAYLQSNVSLRSETLAKLEEFNKPEPAEEIEERAEEQAEAEERFVPSLAMMEKIQKQKELELQLNK